MRSRRPASRARRACRCSELSHDHGEEEESRWEGREGSGRAAGAALQCRHGNPVHIALMKPFLLLPRRHLIEVGVAMLVYALVLCASVFLLKTGYFEGSLATLVALLPVLPCLAACWAVLRQLRRLDDRALRVQAEALGLAFFGTALLSLGYGFLEGLGWPRLSMFAVWPVMAVLWVVGAWIAGRRSS